jgi:hypothetical protein
MASMCVADKTFIQSWSSVHSTVQKFLEFLESSWLTRNSVMSWNRSAGNAMEKIEPTQNLTMILSCLRCCDDCERFHEIELIMTYCYTRLSVGERVEILDQSVLSESGSKVNISLRPEKWLWEGYYLADRKFGFCANVWNYLNTLVGLNQISLYARLVLRNRPKKVVPSKNAHWSA